MNRRRAILITGILILLAACSAAPQGLEVGLEASGQSVTLQVGQILTVRLPSNPTTGYTWQVSQVDPNVLRQVGEVMYTPLEPESTPLAGQGGWETFQFEAAGSGETSLEMVYRRPFEDLPPEQMFLLLVTVQ